MLSSVCKGNTNNSMEKNGVAEKICVNEIKNTTSIIHVQSSLNTTLVADAILDSNSN